MQSRRARSSSTYLACRHWTAEEAGQALADLEQSGLELRAFARREGLDPQRLTRWRRRLAAEVRPAFQEVELGDARATDMEQASAVGHERFEVVLTSGRVVRVPERFDAEALRRLLVVVDEVRAC